MYLNEIKIKKFQLKKLVRCKSSQIAFDPMSVESRFTLTISVSILKRRTPDSILAP